MTQSPSKIKPTERKGIKEKVIKKPIKDDKQKILTNENLDMIMNWFFPGHIRN